MNFFTHFKEWGNLLLLILLSFNTALFSQNTANLKGTIKDAKTGEPLVGASIIVLGTNFGTIADLSGNYSMKIPIGSHKLQVSYVGYKTLRKDIKANSGETITLNFEIESDVIGAQEVVVLGTRTQDRTIINSPVPIDIITEKEIEQFGYSLTTDLIKALVPSYNAPQTSIVDGSDHVRPASLRGLNPDQVLVLVNGKRRYQSALVNVNGTIGRGSAGTDLNAIPASAIERIEVLRDGASAQYGSDAIAGVINIILKNKKGLDLSASLGENITNYERGYLETEGNIAGETNATYSWDGKKESVSIQDGLSKNIHLGYGFDILGGNIYISGAYRNHDYTNRAGLDYRQQYFNVNGQPDPRESTFNRLNHRFGDANLSDIGAFMNGSIPIAEGTQLYTFGGYSYREGSAGGFYRRALDDRNVRAIYPNGFLPMIDTKIYDLSVAAGVKGSLGEWAYDLAEVYGGNEFNFYVSNSLNTSYGTKSPKSFFAGNLKFFQAVTTLDLSRQIEIGLENPLNFAVGGEFRWENYQLGNGETASYLDGGVKILDGPNAGKSAAVGSQVFPGFTPVNVQDQSRTNIGLYVDAENKLNAQLTLGAAARYENYSDFGSTLTGKLSGRYELTENFALRAAISNGFRAPSLSQAYFSSIATAFIGGVPYEVGTFPVNSKVARALGAKDLTAEKSINISFGTTFNLENLSLTIDAYQIDIKGRVVMTENFTGTNIQKFLEAQGINATGGRFFTNALDTRTKGLDITAKYGANVGDGILRFLLSMNFNKTDITNKDKINTPPQLAALTTIPLLGRVEQGRFERGQPLSSWNFQTTYNISDLNFLVRIIRYGSITTFNNNPLQDQTFSSIWNVDAEVSYSVMKNLSIAIGANNLFDTYPDKLIKVNSFNGILPFTSQLPSGFNGRYVYSRLNYSL